MCRTRAGFYVYMVVVTKIMTFFSTKCVHVGPAKLACALLLIQRYAAAEWYDAGLCDREVAGSTPAQGFCVPTLTQRAIPPGSVNEYQRKLGTKVMPRDALAPYPWSRGFGWCPAEGYRKRKSAPPYGPLRLGKGLYFTTGLGSVHGLSGKRLVCCNDQIG